MAISEPFTGTEAVGSTEWSLTTDTSGPDAETSDGIFQIWLDVSDMTTGDELQIKIYEKVQSSDTQRVMYQANLFDKQETELWVSPTFVLINGWDVTLKAISGTITVLWSIRKVA